MEAEVLGAPNEHRPSNQDALREYDINIQFMSRGCVIRVGCKSIAFSEASEGMAELQKYFESPYETQQEWRSKLN